jgi:uncharacterized repeat protein (TIGR01451 family)
MTQWTRVAVVAVAMVGGLISGEVAAQDPDFQLTKQLVSPAAGATVPPGTPVRYRITYRCNGLVATTCGSLSISDTLPPQLEVVGCDFPGFTVGSCTPGSGTITATRASLPAGTTGEAFIDTRVRPSAAAASNVVNPVQGTISQPSTNPPQTMPVTAFSPPINISGATQRNYTITKARVDPIPALAISDQATFVTDRVQFCATGGVDLVALAGATIYDDVPAIATNIRTTIPGGSPPIGQSIVGNRVTWTIPPERLTIDALYPPGSNLSAPVCFSFFLTYDLPAGAAPAPDRAHVRTPDSQYCPESTLGVPPVGDTANPQCFGATNGNRGPAQSLLTPFSKSGNDATPSDTPNDQGIGRINWRLNANFESNVGLRDVSFYEILPLAADVGGTLLAVDSFAPGNWASGTPVYEVVADVYATATVPAPEDSCGVAAAGWTTLLASGIAANNTTVFTSAAIPANATGFCWVFRNISPNNPANEVPRDFAFTTQPRVTQPVPSTIVPPALPSAFLPENCLRARWNTGVLNTLRTCRTQRIEQARPGVDPVKGVQSAPSPLRPLDTIVFRVGVDHAVGDSTGTIVDPVLIDLLPAQLEFVSATVVQPASPSPTITTVANFGAPNQTLVRIAYSGSFPRTAAQMPRIDITTRVRAFTGDGVYTNRFSVFENGAVPRTCAGSEVADSDDRDQDSNTTELRCDRDASFTVAQAAVLDGSKWISGTGPYANPTDALVDDPTEAPTVANASCPTFSDAFGAGTGDAFTRFPCVARTSGYGNGNGGNGLYRIRIQNAGNVAFDNYVLYDVLPFIGDTGVGQPLAGQARNTDFRPVLLGAPTLNATLSSGSPTNPGVFTIEYSASTNPCRPEVSSNDVTTGWQTGCTNDWNANAAALGGFAAVRAFRIRAFVDPNGTDAVNWGVGDTAVFEIPIEVPATAPRIAPSIIGDATQFTTAWGSFAHRAYRAVTNTALDPINLLPTAEPPKVGIVTPERYRLGNLIWRDINNNGTRESGEPGINGVAIRLCRDNDGSAGPSATDATIASTTTALIGSQNGKYVFELLERQSDYYLAIASNPVQLPLTGLSVSAVNNADPANNTDNDNNAQFTPATAACGGGEAIVSRVFDVGTTPGSGTEPGNEVVRSGGGGDDDPNAGTGGAEPWPDDMSNYSVDFGFAPPAVNADLGDLPDTGGGSGGGNYTTNLSDNGPSHLERSGLTLGTVWDSELDGAPSALANGDDLALSDDEDGVETLSQLTVIRGQPASVQVRVVNTTGVDARLCSFVDWNGDGDFNDTVNGNAEARPAVTVTSPTAAGGDLIAVSFGTAPFVDTTVTPNNSRQINNLYWRFRFGTTAVTCNGAAASGPQTDGEVEDYVGTLIAVDRGDLPDGLVGLPAYPTLIANNGAAHTIVAGLRLGSIVDPETEGQPNATAIGDDSAPGGSPDDEDGVTVADLTMIAGSNAAVRLTATNTTGATARVCGYVDFDADGDLTDANEFATATVANGTNNGTVTLNFAVPTNAARTSFSRFRITTAASCSPVGAVSDGEVEDYAVTINAFDLGDLPDAANGIGTGNYQTRVADAGARHPILPGFPAAPNLFLGANVDVEPDGQPGVTATGDDLALGDDENGIDVADLALTVNVAPLIDLTATNQAGAAARVCGFIDTNADGDFADAGESASVAVPSGTTAGAFQLAFAPPLAGAAANTYARFRISTDTAGACAPNGDASNGEVEDYVVSIVELSDLGDLPDTSAGTGTGNYQTLASNGGARNVLRAGLFLGAVVDNESDGVPGVAANGDDLAAAPDDEDGINVADLGAANLVVGRAAIVRAIATNTTGTVARLCGYLDFNGDGDFLDAQEVAQALIADGVSNGNATLAFGIVPSANTVRSTYARFRLSTIAGACTGANANGVEGDGEVEDYGASITVSDLGDLPDTGAGVGSGNYRTLLADGGPTHPIIAGLRLGATVDAEADGQPNTSANGDDLVQGGAPPADDEDGVDTTGLQFDAGVARNIAVTATNTTGSAARLCAFIDFDRDGNFSGAEVQSAAVPAGSNNLAQNLSFTPPLGTAFGPVYARFRLSTDTAGVCVSDGPASDGEVEDYVGVVGNVDLGDAPDGGAGTGVGNYNTLRGDTGAEHVIVAGLFMGQRVDQELDAQPNIAADGDDAAVPSGPLLDDEDGVQASALSLIASTNATIPVVVTNTATPAVSANLCGYIDFNGDGDFADAGEFATATIASGSNAASVDLDFGTVPPAPARSTYARFRLSTAACAPTGLALNGEVEDYRVAITAYDLGDLPNGVGANLYPTLRAAGGPRHEIIDNLRLGAAVDPDADGQPNTAADGDDAAGQTPDDEDGVTFDPLNLGSPGRANVTALNNTGANATLCAYVDWNGDGDFADSYTITQPGGGTTTETLSRSVPSGAAAQNFVLQLGIVPPPGTVGVPATGAITSPYARFRLTTTPGFSCASGASDPPAGVSPNGEVEDYRIGATTGTGLMSLGDLVWQDLDNNCVRNAGEPGLGGVAVSLFRDSNDDGLPDGPALSTQNTSATGAYLFTNLVPDTYVVRLQRPTRYIGSTGSNPYRTPGLCEPGADPDTDATDSADKGTGAGTSVTEIVSRPVTLVPKAEPDDGTNGYWRVDFGLLPNFDLELTKALAPTQAASVALNSVVNYRITVTNRGTIPGTQIVVIDRIPPGMVLADAAWTAAPGNTARRTIAGPLAPGASEVLTIALRVVATSGQGYVNRAEIFDFRDDGGTPVRDIDSTPNNDQPPEDDQGSVPIAVPDAIPVNSPLALALLLLVIGMVGAARLRRARALR